MIHGADDVARRIVDNLGTIDSMALQKLLYYSQAWYLAITSDRLFPNAIEAWAKGPVVAQIYREHAREVLVSEWPTGDATRLSESAAGVVDLVCATYGRLNGWELSQLTHSERPWLEARDGLGPDESSHRNISIDSMRNYYSQRTLGGYYPADLRTAGGPFHTSVGGEDHARQPDFRNVIGLGQRETPAPDALRHLAYPSGASRVRPTRVS